MVALDVRVRGAVDFVDNDPASQVSLIVHAKIDGDAALLSLDVKPAGSRDDKVAVGVNLHLVRHKPDCTGAGDVHMVRVYVCGCLAVDLLDDHPAGQIAVVPYTELRRDARLRALHVQAPRVLDDEAALGVAFQRPRQGVGGGGAGDVHMVRVDQGGGFILAGLAAFIDSKGDFASLHIIAAVSCADDHPDHVGGLLELCEGFAQLRFGVRLPAPAAATTAAGLFRRVAVDVNDVRDIVADVRTVAGWVDQVHVQADDLLLERFPGFLDLHDGNIMEPKGLVPVPQAVQVGHRAGDADLRLIGPLKRLPRLLQEHVGVLYIGVLVIPEPGTPVPAVQGCLRRILQVRLPGWLRRVAAGGRPYHVRERQLLGLIVAAGSRLINGAAVPVQGGQDVLVVVGDVRVQHVLPDG